MRNRNKIQKILIALEDKREYILSNPEISNEYIKCLVKTLDETYDDIELIYDKIITNKSVYNEIILNILSNMEKRLGIVRRMIDGSRRL